ncbi:MAG: hypothetical protein RL299_174 [Pseudomonadota bacterium]|jgi:hypothetical protein
MEITHAEQTAVSAAMPPAERAALALNSSQTERDLRELAVKHTSIQAIKDKAGRDQAHGAAMEVKRARTTIERIAKEARDDATKFSRAVIAEQNRLVAIIEPEEQRLLTLRDDWDVEQERIKEAAAAAERLRVEQIMGRIDAIKHFERMARDCRTSGAVQRLQEAMAKIDLTGMDEFDDQARRTYCEVTEAMMQILTQRQTDEAERARVKAEQEAEAARLAAERAELERQRAEAAAAAQAAQAKAKAEADRLAAERANLEAARAEFEQRQKAHEERERAEQAAREAAAWAALEAQEAEQEAVPQVNEVIDVPLIAAPLPEPIGIDQPAEAATPSAAQLIQAVAEMFGVGLGEARDWLIDRAADIEAAQP